MFENENDPDGVKVSQDPVNPAGLKDANQLPPKSGLYHTARPMGELFFKKAPNEQVMKTAGAYIVLGTDRPGSDRSGYGMYGADNAASIDLVVGRMASANKGKGPESPAYVDPSFAADAARIHIAQLTDVDHNCGLAQSDVPQTIARSGIVIKADAIRVVGREGIKIVTGVGDGYAGFGSHGETNSLGGKIHQPSPEISFIAGNSTDDRIVWGGLFNPRERIRGLQPLTLGYVTRDAFADLGEQVNQLCSVVMMLTYIQGIFNSIIGADPFRSWVPPASVSSTAALLSFVSDTSWHIVINNLLWEMNYLWPFGYKFICSRNVKTT